MKTQSETPVAVQTIRHTGIVVSDMARSLEFYRNLLGLEVWADFQDDSEMVQAVTGVPGAKIWMVKLKTPDGTSIELLKYLSHPQPIPPPGRACDVGCNHVAFQVVDLDALYEKLSQHEIRFHVPPMVTSDGSVKLTYCRDPEGVIVELVELLNNNPSR